MHRQTASLAQLVGTQTVHGARRMPIALHAPTASTKATRVRLCASIVQLGSTLHSQLVFYQPVMPVLLGVTNISLDR